MNMKLMAPMMGLVLTTSKKYKDLRNSDKVTALLPSMFVPGKAAAMMLPLAINNMDNKVKAVKRISVLEDEKALLQLTDMNVNANTDILAEIETAHGRLKGKLTIPAPTAPLGNFVIANGKVSGDPGDKGTFDLTVGGVKKKILVTIN